MAVKIGIVGACGRMGVEIANCILKNQKAQLSISLGRNIEKNSIFPVPNLLTTEIDKVFQEADVIIDFSSPEGLQECLKQAIKHQKPLVSGTTGIDDNVQNAIQKASKEVKICYSGNMSIGVAIMKNVLKTLSKQLADYDCEILEIHHNEKKDSPSGTSLLLGKAVAEARGQNFEKVANFNRSGKRLKDEIGFASIRGGSVFGEHEIMFIGQEDQISIKHTAFNRTIFAKGAVQAAISLFEKSQKAGLFQIDELV
ncbi:MAG: dihydrodipicolinate reductase [Pseudomonadota bacterium]|jgi:4-hydroxy-tetrahydrodipicolinate reductase